MEIPSFPKPFSRQSWQIKPVRCDSFVSVQFNVDSSSCSNKNQTGKVCLLFFLSFFWCCWVCLHFGLLLGKELNRPNTTVPLFLLLFAALLFGGFHMFYSMRDRQMDEICWLRIKERFAFARPSSQKNYSKGKEYSS